MGTNVASFLLNFPPSTVLSPLLPIYSFSSPCSSASACSSCSYSSSKLPAGTSYRRRMDLLGSLTRTNLPSSRLRHISAMVRTIPQPLDRDRFIWLAKSRGFQPMTPRMTCLSLERGLTRETKLRGKGSALVIRGSRDRRKGVSGVN